MGLTPAAHPGARRSVAPRLRTQRRPVRMIRAWSMETPVIIAGFGRFGQVVGRVLRARGIRSPPWTPDPTQIDFSDAVRGRRCSTATHPAPGPCSAAPGADKAQGVRPGHRRRAGLAPYRPRGAGALPAPDRSSPGRGTATHAYQLLELGIQPRHPRDVPLQPRRCTRDVLQESGLPLSEARVHAWTGSASTTSGCSRNRSSTSGDEKKLIEIADRSRRELGVAFDRRPGSRGAEERRGCLAPQVRPAPLGDAPGHRRGAGAPPGSRPTGASCPAHVPGRPLDVERSAESWRAVVADRRRITPVVGRPASWASAPPGPREARRASTAGRSRPSTSPPCAEQGRGHGSGARSRRPWTGWRRSDSPRCAGLGARGHASARLPRRWGRDGSTPACPSPTRSPRVRGSAVGNPVLRLISQSSPPRSSHSQ